MESCGWKNLHARLGPARTNSFGPVSTDKWKATFLKVFFSQLKLSYNFCNSRLDKLYFTSVLKHGVSINSVSVLAVVVHVEYANNLLLKTIDGFVESTSITLLTYYFLGFLTVSCSPVNIILAAIAILSNVICT